MTKTPWNKGKAVGKKKGFEIEQIELIRKCLIARDKTMELALLNVALDTMLRSSDLTKLKVGDVMDCYGQIKSHVNLKQQKTKHSHLVALSPISKEWLSKWISEGAKRAEDYLFNPRIKGGGYKNSSLSRHSYASIIKGWCKDYLCIDPKDHSTHSLRRTRARIIYFRTRNIEVIRQLLGHKSIASTINYLGVEQEEALRVGEENFI